MMLRERIALITGAGSGIGRAAAITMAREGAKVFVSDRNLAAAEATAKVAPESIACRLDVADDAETLALIDSIQRQYGRIDILHNHAGLQVAGDLEHVDPDYLDQSWLINVRAQFMACRAVMPIMRKRGKGVILNTASNAGLFLDRAMLAYISTKSALITMTKQIALDYARHGIRVNAICPGWVDTAFNDPYTRQLGGRAVLEKTVATSVPMGRFGAPEEVAACVLFLVSDMSSFVTGHALVVDGGESLSGGAPV
jgi:NAD(P)-dependent dehydrogenase (short-subunit alcohol dehydrogenase family)